MKTFDISKSIILAFIILISVALKLSAHESTTLIGSTNVPIEKDKNEESVFKKAAKKTILCYERYKSNIIKNRIFFFVCSAFAVLVSWLKIFQPLIKWLWSIYTEYKTKKGYLKAIKGELEGNINNLTKKYKDVFAELLENNLSKLEKYLSEIGIDNAIYDFNNNYEFCEKFKGLSLPNFCRKINEDLTAKNISQIPEVDTGLNGLLCDTSFYDNIFKKIKPDISLSEEIEALVKKTQKYRDKNFSELNKEQQYFIKRLNRLLIEQAYPEKSPNIKVTRLTKALERDSTIDLSDTSWNQHKDVIGNNIINEAYMLIREINAKSKTSSYQDKDKILPRLAETIINAKDAIDKAIEKL